MDVVSEAAERGVVERRFELKVGTEAVPGIQWLPEEADAPHPTVLVGHGGTQHKRAPNVLALARSLVRHLGVGVVALDAPEHGDRVTDAGAAEAARAALAERMTRRAPMSEERLRQLAERVPKHVAEWRALLDDLGAGDARTAGGPFGWWGVSMGTSHGLPLVAEEPRIAAAVLGLNGLRPGDDGMKALAAKVTVPVLFLFQWDDELMTRESGLAMWDAFASTEKCMHINPGGHVEMPLYERKAVEEFFARHLLSR